MMYRFRTGVDHEYKRKFMISSAGIIMGTILLASALHTGFQTTGTTGNTSLTHVKKENSQNSDQAASNGTDGQLVVTNGNVHATSASSSALPKASAIKSLSSSIGTYAAPRTAGGFGSSTLQPTISPLPVGGLGGDDSGGSPSASPCLCETIMSTVNGASGPAKPLADTVQQPTPSASLPGGA